MTYIIVRGVMPFIVAAIATLAVATGATAQFEATEPFQYTVSSSQMQKFAPTAGGTAVECTTLQFSSSYVGKVPTETVTVSPSYSNCENFLGQPTSVNTNGCKYVFHSAANSTTGTTDVVCEAGKAIEIVVGSICRYTIGSQNGLGTITFKNGGTGETREITVEPNVTGITSTRTTNHFFCPNGGSTGTYVGNSNWTGEQIAENRHVGVWVD